MLSVASRWKIAPQVPATRIAIGDAAAGALYADERGQVVMLDADARIQWAYPVEDSLRRVALLPSGKGAFILTVRELVRLGPGGTPVWRSAPPPFPLDLAVRADGAVLALTADSGVLRVLNAAGRETWTRRTVHATDYAQLLPDGTGVVAVSRRGDVTFFSAEGEPLWKLALCCEAGRPDVSAEKIVIPSFDGVYAFAHDGSPAGVYDVGAPAVRTIFGEEGRTLLVQDAKKRLRLVDVATGTTRWELALPEDPRDIAWASDGRAILIAGWTGELERLDVADVDQAAAAPPAAAAQATGAFLDLGGKSAAGGPEAPPACAPRLRWRVPLPGEGAASLLTLPHGRGVAVLDADEQTLGFFSGDATPAWSATHLGPSAILAASDDGETIVAGGSHGVRFFRADRGEVANAAVAARAIEVAAGGSAVLVGAEGSKLHLFDAWGRRAWEVPAPGFTSMGISPSAAVMAIARGGTVVAQLRGGKGGFQKAVAPDTAHDGIAVRVVVFDDAVVFASRAGRVGELALDGTTVFEDALPPGFPVDRAIRSGGDVLVATGGGTFRLERAGARRLRPLRTPPGTRPEERSAFAVFMDRLLEFRYDSTGIACLEAAEGRLSWRRATGSLPRALSVSADGSALAGIVGGELVLYDLVAGSAEPGAPGAPPAETPPTFLEL